MLVIWRLWAKALGAKEGNNDREADTIAGIRTLILVCYMVTNVAIVANAVRHWDKSGNVPVLVEMCGNEVKNQLKRY